MFDIYLVWSVDQKMLTRDNVGLRGGVSSIEKLILGILTNVDKDSLFENHFRFNNLIISFLDRFFWRSVCQKT